MLSSCPVDMFTWEEEKEKKERKRKRWGELSGFKLMAIIFRFVGSTVGLISLVTTMPNQGDVKEWFVYPALMVGSTNGDVKNHGGGHRISALLGKSGVHNV